MKKYLVFAAAAMLAFVGCNKEGEGEGNGGNTTPVFEATFTLDGEAPALEYGEPVILKGTVSESCDAVIFTGVKKDGENYTTVGEDQNAKLEELTATAEFFADSKEMTDLMVTIKKGKAEAKSYIPVKAVKGEPKGDIWMDDCVTLTAEKVLKTCINAPEAYPNGGGEGSDVKSFIHLRGAQINGKVEHVLSLNQAREIGGSGISIGFCNVLASTNTGTILKEKRGFAIQRAKYWPSGTPGRQCDTVTVNNKKFDPQKADQSAQMTLLNGSWKAGQSEEMTQLYAFVDKLFLNIKEANTNLEKIRAYHQLSEIQKQCDNETLGETEHPTKLPTKGILFRRVDAGHLAKPQMTEGFRAGDYIILRSTKDEEGIKTYYYGIMQIIDIDDDSFAINTENNSLDAKKAEQLFGKTITLDIKAQCELFAK